MEMPRNQMNEPRKRPPGPTNWVKTSVARSSGRRGGKPPEITTVSERTMKSMPRVVMKLGIAKLSVMNPFTKPIAAAMTSPKTMAGTSGTPAMMRERSRHRHEREGRADREVELAANHQDRHPDRDEADLRQQPENAAQIVRRQEDAAGPHFEDEGENERAARRRPAPASRDRCETGFSKSKHLRRSGRARPGGLPAGESFASFGRWREAPDGVWPAASMQVGTHDRCCGSASVQTRFPLPVRRASPAAFPASRGRGTSRPPSKALLRQPHQQSAASGVNTALPVSMSAGASPTFFSR